jgi:hypothetical protein
MDNSPLSHDFLISSIRSKFDWLTGIYGRIVAWNEYGRYGEYVQITHHLNTTYEPELLKRTANDLYFHMSIRYQLKSSDDNIRKRNEAELECLNYVKFNGKCPDVEYNDVKYKELIGYEKNPNTPICLKDLIRCLTTQSLPSNISDYYKTYVLSFDNYSRYISNNGPWNLIFCKIIDEFSELKQHIDPSILN